MTPVEGKRVHGRTLITALSFALGSTTLVVILGIAISRRFGFECRKILSHRTLSLLLLSPIEFIGRLAVITACLARRAKRKQDEAATDGYWGNVR